MVDLLSLCDWIAALLFAGAIGMAALSHKEIKAARAIVWIAAGIFALRWGMWGFTTDQHIGVRILVGAVVGAFLCGVLPPVFAWIGAKVDLNRPEEIPGPKPILRLMPNTNDASIKWEEKELLPISALNSSDPFAFILKNVGSLSAIDIKIRVTTDVSSAKLISVVRRSGFFRLSNKESEETKIPLQFTSGKMGRFVIPTLEDVSILNVTSISPNNSEFLSMPPPIKNKIVVASLLHGFEYSATEDEGRKKLRENRNDMELLSDSFKKLEFSVPLKESPIISVEIEYKDENGRDFKETFSLRSAYIPIAGPFFFSDVKDGTTLTFNGGFGWYSYQSGDIFNMHKGQLIKDDRL